MNNQDLRDLKESNLFGVVRKKISELYYICIAQNLAIAILYSYDLHGWQFPITVGLTVGVSSYFYGKSKVDFDKV
jgi:hypothetical protein